MRILTVVVTISPMSTQSLARRIPSIMWFPVLFAVALPVIFQLAFHAPDPHEVPIGVVGSASQVQFVRQQLTDISSAGFRVQRLTNHAALSEVRGREVAAVFVAQSSPVLYVARAASAIRANYLVSVFVTVAKETGSRPPVTVDLVPLLPGDTGAGIFFFVFPMMMVGVITVIVLLQRAGSWSIGERMFAVAGAGAVGASTAYLTAMSLNVLPEKPILLLVAFLLSMIFGWLFVGAAPLLKQYFLPVALAFALVVGTPSAGATITPDLLPTGLRYLSDVLPMAQGVKVTRDVAYFDGAGAGLPTLILILWASFAALVVSIAWYRQPSRRTATTAIDQVMAPFVSQSVEGPPTHARPIPAPALTTTTSTR
jgi:hypothetical protein